MVVGAPLPTLRGYLTQTTIVANFTTVDPGGTMRRILILLIVALALAGAGCVSQSDQSAAPATSAEPATTAPPTTLASTTTTAPPATLASTTTRAPSRARQLQRALKRKYSRVRTASEDADGITIKTSYIFTYDNAAASVGICETTKALLGDDSFVEVVAVDNRWLARTTVFTGRCKATTLIR
jgi:PBP1b-binding outer membrane lipoprotein LpoB